MESILVRIESTTSVFMTSVVASGELDGKPHPMTKGADGVWSVTIGPLAPDIYTYSFNVDGVSQGDSFGLNSGGYPTARSPLPYNWTKQIQIIPNN